VWLLDLIPGTIPYSFSSPGDGTFLLSAATRPGLLLLVLALHLSI
jgi:hypothetical protein